MSETTIKEGEIGTSGFTIGIPENPLSQTPDKAIAENRGKGKIQRWEILEECISDTYELPTPLPDKMPGNHIFVFLDGTWNEERDEQGVATPTNVLRMFDELNEVNARGQTKILDNNPKIIASYYRGVGNRQDNSTYDRLWFGFNGKDEERIRAAAFAGVYREYKSTKDSIYIVGFSRGAASARLLARDICIKGFPRKLNLEITRVSNLLTGQTEARVIKVDREGECVHKPKVAFLGCWDTVDAFVLPSRFPDSKWDKVVRVAKKYVLVPRLSGVERFEATENVIPDGVKKAVHCVAIDETRNAFLPTLMPRAVNVEEVWFPGVHADVGGGYKDSALADAPYQFMRARLAEAMEAELAPHLSDIKSKLADPKQALLDDAKVVELVAERGRVLAISTVFESKPAIEDEPKRPPEYCFHFHGLNSDVKRVKGFFGFGSAIRAIRILDNDGSEKGEKGGIGSIVKTVIAWFKEKDEKNDEKDSPNLKLYKSEIHKPKLHVSTFSVMNSGLVFAANRRDKRTWTVKYDPFNVRELKEEYELIDERTMPASNNIDSETKQESKPFNP